MPDILWYLIAIVYAVFAHDTYYRIGPQAVIRLFSTDYAKRPYPKAWEQTILLCYGTRARLFLASVLFPVTLVIMTVVLTTIVVKMRQRR